MQDTNGRITHGPGLTPQTINYQYNGNSISFQIGNGEVMINATTMGRKFSKEVRQWFDNPGTHEFIETLAETRGLNPMSEKRTSVNTSALANRYPSLIKVVKGGDPLNQGTWMHEDVALEFARWLSPAFSIWCNDRIKELMRHGATAINPDNLLDPDYIIMLATKLKEERARNESLRASNAIQSRELKNSAPNVEYHDHVLQSTTAIPLTIIAKELGTSAVMLNRELKSRGIQYKQRGTWLLTSRYQNLGLTVTRTHAYVDSYGNTKTEVHTYWTEKGRKFIHDVIHLNSGQEFDHANNL